MHEKQLQQLIEDSMKKNQITKISSKEEELYASIFQELNQIEEPKVPFHFSNKVTREAIKINVIKKRLETKFKIIGLILASFIIAGIVFKIFDVKIDFITSLPLSYFIYSLGAFITFILIEIGDFYLLKKS